MANPNNSPIFTSGIDVTWMAAVNSVVVLSACLTGTAAADYNGTTSATLVYTAGSYGSYVNKLILEPAGTNIQSVLRIFVNNGSANTTAANNSKVMEIGLPSTTAVNNNSLPHIEVPLQIQLPASYRLYVTLGAASTPLASGWFCTAFAGKY